MSGKVSTQDKARLQELKAEALAEARGLLASDDLGDRADRYGPDLANLVKRIAEIEGWTGR